jgi:hypothetical protein
MAFGIIEPGLDDGLDGMVAAAEPVVHDNLRQRRVALVRHLPALPPDEKLHHIAVLGEFNAVAVRPLVELKVIRSAGVGVAVEKGGHLPLPHLILHGQPGLSAQGLHHGVEGSARLGGVLCASLVSGLRL